MSCSGDNDLLKAREIIKVKTLSQFCSALRIKPYLLNMAHKGQYDLGPASHLGPYFILSPLAFVFQLWWLPVPSSKSPSSFLPRAFVYLCLCCLCPDIFRSSSHHLLPSQGSCLWQLPLKSPSPVLFIFSHITLFYFLHIPIIKWNHLLVYYPSLPQDVNSMRLTQCLLYSLLWPY